jgi:UDP-galactopyranose mutase
MDELANFKFAPPELTALERELMTAADVVFTGGYSLWEAKRDRHPNIHPFPSSVDREHFAQARQARSSPPTRPACRARGWASTAWSTSGWTWSCWRRWPTRAQWTLVIVGPVVKIDPAELPRRPNLHYLGSRPMTSCRPIWAAGTWR